MSKTMMLTKPYTPNKLVFPVLVSEKLDGVPVVISINKNSIVATSRSGKMVFSVNHIIEAFRGFQGAVKDGITFNIVGELYSSTLAFKDISGQVRKQDGTEADVCFNIFDYYGTDDNGDLTKDKSTDKFCTRYLFLDSIIKCMDHVNVITQQLIPTQAELDAHIIDFFSEQPEAEGIVIKNSDGIYSFTRTYNCQKLKAVDTHDLIVESFEEAINKKTGKGLNMVGRINCQYETDRGESITIGVGPGKLTHEERKQVWGEQHIYIGQYAEVNAMPDKSYEALREPRFIRWRFDK